MAALAGLLAFLGVFRCDAAESTNWNKALTPHFEIAHESSWMPPGFTIGLEKIHNRLRLDLAMFSPWMAKERLKLFLHTDQKSYVAGEFEPPAWSNGIAMYEKRTVVVYDQPSRPKLLEVIAHETTHLLFESYWGELGKEPPPWLNEGLAMLEEANAQNPERSDWYRAMVELPSQRPMPLEDLVRINPTSDLGNDKDAVGVWYTQSYSIVHFLFRKHSKLQFKNFCSKLRDGKTVQEALWLVYRYQSIAKFEKAWQTWLKDPGHQKRLDSLPVAASLEPVEQEKKQIGKISGFKPLGAPRALRKLEVDGE